MANFLKSLFIKGVEIDPAGAENEQVLKYNGTKFVPGTASTVGSIDDLSDVVVTEPADGQSLVFNGTNWINELLEVSGGTAISDSPPAEPTQGDLWYESDTGSTFVYYDSYWVELGGGPAGETGPAGPQGIQGIQGETGPAGVGVPDGGTTGQILSKTSDTSYATQWIDNNPVVTLDGLTDVTISDPNNGQVLLYSGSQWVNQVVSTDPMNDSKFSAIIIMDIGV